MQIKNLQITKNRLTYFSISGVLILISLFLLLGTKLNLGIDMTGGTQGEYSYKSIDIIKTRESINEISKKITYDNKKIINSTSVYKISGEDKINIIIGYDNSIDTKALEKLKNVFRKNVLSLLQKEDKTVIETQYINIGKSFGDYIKNTALLTLSIAIGAIALYLAWAFSGIASGISTYSFSLITIITLFHDVIISAGLYIFFGIFFPEFKIDTFFITALLTILGYSINDTIVIFDRIRANLEIYIKKNKNLDEIIEISISETIRRSIYTSLTLMFVLITIFFFGPDSISGFTLVMIFGTFIGTYSSIFLASPLLFEMNKNKELGAFKKKKVNNEDKIVV